MYTRIKGLVLKAIPKKLLFRHEYSLRYVYYLTHKGSKYQCNMCKAHLSSFVSLKNDRLCPRCGSLQRTRRLWQILNEGFLKEDVNILDFSPTRSLYRLLKTNKNYLSSDLSGDFISNVAYDITAIESESESFGLVICYHILEHIEEDIKAMKEIYRILQNGGHCIIQTPFKAGDIYEDYSIKTPADREIHFGQDDHVRIYSVDGLKQRLESVGFSVKVILYTSDQENLNELRTSETVLICEKTN